ncbi:MAG: magnesium transporter [Christensenellales bacterium]
MTTLEQLKANAIDTQQILELIEKNQWARLRSILSEANPVDVASLLESLDDNDRMLVVFRLLPKDLAANVFAYLDSEFQAHIAASISKHEIRTLMDTLFLDDAVDFLEEVPANVVTRVLANTDETTRRLINQFLNYPDNSAGSIMTIEFVRIHKDWTVKQAMDSIRKTAPDKETIYTCYVVNQQRNLLGTVELRHLLLAPDDTVIRDIMEDNPVSVHTLDDREIVAGVVRKYDLMAIPVVDNEARLVGIITIDDVVDVIEEENTEDFEKMAAMHPSEDQYLRTPVLTLAKNRILWLMILMVSATFTGKIITHYDNVLEHVVILASFIPMLMDTGGNCGSQASTMIIRGMALGEIRWKDFFKVLFKETRVGLLVACGLTVVNFARLMLFERTGLQIAFVMNISLFATVVLAKIIGSILPMLAKKVRLDPALMASPIITTIVDACSLMIYFFVATRILNIVA